MDLEAIPEEDLHPITSHEAACVLWAYGDTAHGIEPSGFVTKLLDAMDSADLVNLERFGRGFPGYVEAVLQAKHHAEGIDRLRQIAAGA